MIATEGATFQMVDANGYGHELEGPLRPGGHRRTTAGAWRGRRHPFSETVKLVLLAGRHTIDTQHGKHYAMARNLAFALRGPTTRRCRGTTCWSCRPRRSRPRSSPARRRPGEEVIGRALEMIANTCPTDVTGHPAASCRPAWSTACPPGMMIIGSTSTTPPCCASRTRSSRRSAGSRRRRWPRRRCPRADREPREGAPSTGYGGGVCGTHWLVSTPCSSQGGTGPTA